MSSHTRTKSKILNLDWRNEIRSQVRNLAPNMLQVCDIDAYTELFLNNVEFTGYKRLNDSLIKKSRTIKKINESVSYLYNKYSMFRLLEGFNISLSKLKLPKSIVSLYPQELERISQQLIRFDLDFYDLSRDDFLKDLAILTHRLIPIGAEFAAPNAGIPRSTLFRGGFRQLISGLGFFVFRLQGFKPMIALHAHNLSLGEFNPQGWTRSFLRIAELLELNTEIRGWFSASWFVDPALEAISPNLAYLRAVPQQHGAAIFFVQHDHEGTSGALAKSATRRRLFEEGKYIPAIYMRVWPRKAALEWLEDMRSSSEHK